MFERRITNVRRFPLEVMCPQINGLEIHSKCGSQQSELTCAGQEDSLWSLRALLRSPRWLKPHVAGANETYYTRYKFGKGKTIEILSHKLDGGRGRLVGVGWGGVTQYRAFDGKHDRCGRFVCVYVGFFFLLLLPPWSQIRKAVGPLRGLRGTAGIHSVFTEGSRACVSQWPILL